MSELGGMAGGGQAVINLLHCSIPESYRYILTLVGLHNLPDIWHICSIDSFQEWHQVEQGVVPTFLLPRLELHCMHTSILPD